MPRKEADPGQHHQNQPDRHKEPEKHCRIDAERPDNTNRISRTVTRSTRDSCRSSRRLKENSKLTITRITQTVMKSPRNTRAKNLWSDTNSIVTSIVLLVFAKAPETMEPKAEKDLSSRSVLSRRAPGLTKRPDLPGAEETQKGLEIDDTLLRQSPEGRAELKEDFFPTGNARFEKTKLAFLSSLSFPFCPCP